MLSSASRMARSFSSHLRSWACTWFGGLLRYVYI